LLAMHQLYQQHQRDIMKYILTATFKKFRFTINLRNT